MFARKKLSFFLPQETKFILKKETQRSLLFHNQNSNHKIVALKIAYSLYCYQIGLCFKNKEIFIQFQQSFLPLTLTEDSRDQHNLMLSALYLPHQDVSSMETCTLSIYDSNKLYNRANALAELLCYINEFDPLNMSMINKIDEKFFSWFKNLAPQLKDLNPNLKNQLTSAYNKGAMIGFFQQIKLPTNIDTLLDKNLINEEDGKNLALVAKNIALTGTKMHNEEAERISLRR